MQTWQALQKGQLVFQMFNAANRDPAYSKDSDTFNIHRKNNPRIAFGFGLHFCIGATLARTEAFITVGTLIQRFPNLRLVDAKPDWDSEKRNSRVLNKLPVKF